MPTCAGRRHRAGVIVHRSRTLRPVDCERVDQIPVTSVARTLLDIAALLAPGPLERAVEQSLRLRLFDNDAVRSLIDADPTRPGARTLGRIVASIHDEPPLTRSELEALMRDLCVAHGFPRPEVNAIVDRARDAMLTVRGHRVVSFTHRQLTRERDRVAVTLRSLLTATAPAYPHASR